MPLKLDSQQITQELANGDICPAFQGKAHKVLRQQSGEIKRGKNAGKQWSFQKVIFTDAKGEVPVMFWDREPIEGWEGKTFLIQAKNGKNGLYAEDEDYKGETRRILKATTACLVEEVNGSGGGQAHAAQQEPAQSSPQASHPQEPTKQPQQSQPAPQNGGNGNGNGNGEPKMDDWKAVRRRYGQYANLWRICYWAAKDVIAEIEASEGAPSEELLGRVLRDIYYTARGEGYADQMPVQPITGWTNGDISGGDENFERAKKYIRRLANLFILSTRAAQSIEQQYVADTDHNLPSEMYMGMMESLFIAGTKERLHFRTPSEKI